MQRNSVHDVAAGRWAGILAHFGLSDRQLSGRHGPCPICGGRDRFRFDDKDGRGTFYCSHCGAGTGVDLVMRLNGWDFRTAAKEIEQAAGVVQPGPASSSRSEEEKLLALRRVWNEAHPLQAGDEAMRYLAGRGIHLNQVPAELRLHPGLTYRDGDRVVGKFPAMVARVTGPDGTGLTLHRTYLRDAKKAPVPSPKKLMPGKPISGGAVRLFPAAEHIGIAEGIETALAAAAQFGMPVWSCISAHGIETFEPPAGVQRVTVFADNDENFTGQKAAFAAAHRLSLRGIQVDVQIPEVVGDWLDSLIQKGQR